MNQTKLFSNLIDSILLLIALAWGVCSFIFAYNTNNGGWFSRSGSVIVLICVIVEFRLGNLRQLGFNDAIKAFEHDILISGQLPETKKLICWLAHLQVIIGTLIWGYGDLLF